MTTLVGKTMFDIEDYSFSQTTLEQVFIEFAKQQESEEEHRDEHEGYELSNNKKKCFFL